jgi:hypothetical protein
MPRVDLDSLAGLIYEFERKLAVSQKVKIPDTLPTIQKGIDLFLEWRDQPSKLLSGVVPMELFKGPFIDIDRVWFTGSCAWYPLVMGKKWNEPAGSDIDVCFYDQEQATAFVEHFIQQMEGTMFVGQEPNRFGGAKIFHSTVPHPPQDKHGIMDVFWLPKSGITIAEMISGFTQDHEKVAIVASAQPGDLSAVTRLVRPWEHTWQGLGAPAHREECYACRKTFESHQAKKKREADEAAIRRADYADHDWS